jgi:hypothetical protein
MELREQEETLRKYLLGELSDKEQETLDLWLMSEEDAYDLLSAAEDDLIDESIAGKLNRHELERFNNHFLTAPERKRKLRFGQHFRGIVDARQTGAVSERLSKPALTFWDLFRYQPAFGYAAIGLLVLLVGVGLWAGLRLQEMQRRIDAATAQLASERESFQKRLDESQAKLQSDFRALDQAVANLKSSAAPEGLVAFALMPGLTRTTTDVQKVPLTPKSQLVELSLTLLDDDYDSYRAVLMDDAGLELWTRDHLTPKKNGEVNTVVIVVPSDRLSPGDYSIRLSGRSNSNPPENIRSYPFRATR